MIHLLALSIVDMEDKVKCAQRRRAGRKMRPAPGGSVDQDKRTAPCQERTGHGLRMAGKRGRSRPVALAGGTFLWYDGLTGPGRNFPRECEQDDPSAPLYCPGSVQGLRDP